MVSRGVVFNISKYENEITRATDNMQCLYNTIAIFKQFQIIAIVIMLQSAGTFRVRQDAGRILLTARKTRNFYF